MIDSEMRLARIAYINAQTALFNARIVGMQAENADRLAHGLQVAYTEKAFIDEIESVGRVLGHNAVIEYLMHG